MYEKELKEYIQLVGEATVNKRIELSFSTIYHEDSVEEENTKETHIYIYNGYEDIEIYTFKLASLSYYLERISQYNIQYSKVIQIEIEKLIRLFKVDKAHIFHSSFINLYDDPASGHSTINQEDVKEFISIAYRDIAKLLDNISYSISNLLLGDERDKRDTFKLIKQALIDLGITNEDGVVLKIKKSVLWAFIDVLIENKKINPQAEQKMISLFWHFIKAKGSPPARKHKTDVYNKALSDFQEYFKNVKKCQIKIRQSLI